MAWIHVETLKLRSGVDIKCELKSTVASHVIASTSLREQVRALGVVLPDWGERPKRFENVKCWGWKSNICIHPSASLTTSYLNGVLLILRAPFEVAPLSEATREEHSILENT